MPSQHAMDVMMAPIPKNRMTSPGAANSNSRRPAPMRNQINFGSFMFV